MMLRFTVICSKAQQTGFRPEQRVTFPHDDLYLIKFLELHHNLICH